jgi:hypothetical protein
MMTMTTIMGRKKTMRKKEEESNKAEGEDDEDYTPLSDVEKDETFHHTDEIKTARNEALIPTGRLRDLLSNCHTRFLCQNQVLIVLMTQDQLFHTYGPKVFTGNQMHLPKFL